MTDRPVVRPWTAADAVLAISEDKRGYWHVMLGQPDGTLMVDGPMSLRDVRAAVKEQWARQTSEVQEGLRFGIRKRAGRWYLTELCPDGVTRTFVASQNPARRPVPREAFAPNLRFAVFERDGFRCRYCGDGPDEVVLHVDHVNPVAAGGTNDIDNLVTACEACNLGKSAKVGVQVP